MCLSRHWVCWACWACCAWPLMNEMLVVSCLELTQLRRVLDAIVAEAPSASQATAYRSDAAGCGDAGPSLPSASGTATSTSPEAARTGPARVAAAASSMTGEASSPGKRALLAVSQQFGDLQTADPEAVEAAKHKMSEGYEAHRLRPGDSGYEYDKRVDFGAPMEDNEWDDEDEDEYF